MKRLAFLLLLLSSLSALADVTTQNYSVTYSCTGSTGPYAFTFPISAATAITVTKDGTPTSAYTIVPVNNNYENGGNVTLNASCLLGSTLVLARVTPLTQGTVFTDNMPIPMKTIERSFDKLTEIAQEQYGNLGVLGNWSCPLGLVAVGMANFLPQCTTDSTTGSLVVSAAAFSGADACAKISAADAFIGTGTGTIVVGSALAGGTCATPPVLGKGHSIQFLDFATYNLALTCTDSTTDLTGTCSVSCPSGATLRLPNGANRDILTDLHFATLTGTNSLFGMGDVRVTGCNFDGNASNNSSGHGIRLYGPRIFLDHNYLTNIKQDGMYVESGCCDFTANPNFQTVVSNNIVTDVGGIAYINAANDSFWSNNESYKAIGSGASWGFEARRSAFVSNFDAFINAGTVGNTGGCHVAVGGSIVGTGMECTNDSGFGLKIDATTGSNNIDGVFGCNTCTAVSEGGSADLISGTLVNSTIGFKGDGGGGRYSFAGAGNITIVDCTSINGNISFGYYSADGAEIPFAANCGTPIAINFAGLSRAGNNVTLTTDGANGIRVGDRITVAGALDSSFNGTFTVATVVNTTTLTYAQTAANASSGQGSVTDLDMAPAAGKWDMYLPGRPNGGTIFAISGDTMTVGGRRHKFPTAPGTLAQIDDPTQVWTANQIFANDRGIQGTNSTGTVGLMEYINATNNFVVGDFNDILGTAATQFWWHGALAFQFAAGAIQTSLPVVNMGANGATLTRSSTSEEITLSTSGTTTDSSTNLLPATSRIEAVDCRVTTAITVATDWSVGDSTTAARFNAANSTMTLGATSASTGTAWTTGIASATTGMKQTAAAKLRITTTGTPGAGKIRCVVFYAQDSPPTS